MTFVCDSETTGGEREGKNGTSPHLNRQLEGRTFDLPLIKHDASVQSAGFEFSGKVLFFSSLDFIAKDLLRVKYNFAINIIFFGKNSSKQNNIFFQNAGQDTT